MKMLLSAALVLAGSFGGLSITPASAGQISIVASGADLQGNPFSFDAIFDATDTGSGYQLTSASGTEDTYVNGIFEDAIIEGLISYAGADNNLNTSLMPDFGGISFTTDVAGDTNIFATCGVGPCAIKSVDDPVGYPSSGFELNYSANTVPEPLTFSVFGAGLMGAVAVRRRKRAKA